MLEAERRLLTGDIATRQPPPLDIALATTPHTTAAAATKTTTQLEDVAEATTETITTTGSRKDENVTLAGGFKDILKSSLVKLIEKIQSQPPTATEDTEDATTTTTSTTAKPVARKQPEDQFNFVADSGDGETFLDQLLRKLSVGKSAVEIEKSSADSREVAARPKKVAAAKISAEEANIIDDEDEEALAFMLPTKRPAAAKKAPSLEQRLKQLHLERKQQEKKKLHLSSIFDGIRTTTAAEVEEEEDGDLYELTLDDSILRREGGKVGGGGGSFIQEELNAAARESERLSSDLDQLLAELEGQ